MLKHKKKKQEKFFQTSNKNSMALSSSSTTLRVEKLTSRPRLTSMMSSSDSTLPPARTEKHERMVKDSMETCKNFKMHSTKPSGREKTKPLSSEIKRLRLRTSTQAKDHQSSQRKKIQMLLEIKVKVKIKVKTKVKIPKDLVEQYESVHKAEHRSKSISEG